MKSPIPLRWLVLIGALSVVPLIPMPPYMMHTIILIFFWAYLATAWNIVGGMAGQVSLGHAAFVGLGAYFTYFMLVWYDVSPWIGMLVGIAVAVMSAILVGYPCFKFGVREIYFALATIAFAAILEQLFTSFRDITGGSLGIFLPQRGNSLYYFQFDAKWPYYYIILVLWLVSLLLIKRMKRISVYLMAIREDEDVAASIGIPVTRYKMLALIISSILTSIGGVFYMQYYRYANPSLVFGLGMSVEIALLAIFGGMYSLLGPTIGSLILTPVAEVLRITLGGTYAGIHLLLYSLLLMITIIFMPRGVYGYVEKIMVNRRMGRWPSKLS